jgi:hypothetical protein
LLRLAIIFKAAILNRFMKALAYVVEHDPGIFIPRQSETNVINISVSRHAATSAGIANIAEVVQLGF